MSIVGSLIGAGSMTLTAPAQSRPKVSSRAKRLLGSILSARACALRNQPSATRLSKNGCSPASQTCGASCRGSVKAIAGCLASR